MPETADRRRWWGLGAIALAVIVIGLDTTVLNVALSTLATDLNADTGTLQWIADSYTVVFAAAMLPAAALGDRYGRRTFLVAGLALFGAASAVAAWSGSAGTLIGARAVMGLGAAALAPLGIGMVPAMFTAEERPRALTVLTTGMMLGLPVGPLLGGWLLDHFWWGSVFLINIPVTAIAILGVLTLLPASRAAVARRPDPFGGVLVMLGLGALVFGLVDAPVHGWGSGRVLLALGLGLASLIAFVLVERTLAEPMLDLRLFGNPGFRWATVSVALVSIALFGLLFVVPLYLQVIAGQDAFGTGLRLLPLIGGLVVGGTLADRLRRPLGARTIMAAGFTVLAGGLLLTSRVDETSGYGLLAAGLAVTGFGLGLAMPVAIDVVLAALPDDDAATGMAVTTALRMVAGALGIGLLPSVISSVYTDRVADAAGPALAGLPPEQAARATAAATDSVAGAAEVAKSLGSAGTALRDAAFSAYAHGMGVVLLASAAVSLLGAVLVGAFLPKDRPRVEPAVSPADRQPEPSAATGRP